MTARTFKRLDTVGYHAAAGLVANGAAALAAIGTELLVVSGVPRDDAPKMLGPLLRSVADNVEALGFPDALTGPVRRGDAGAIGRQIDLLTERLPEALPLFLASGLAQLPLAAKIGDAPAAQIEEVGVVLRKAMSRSLSAPKKAASKKTPTVKKAASKKTPTAKKAASKKTPATKQGAALPHRRRSAN
jgi:hypothetical protein